MKTRHFTFAALVLLLGLAACSQDEESKTYMVYTAEDLLEWNEATQNDLSLNCTLAADIDLTDIVWTPAGNRSSQYTGTFDGGGHTITGLTINQEETDYVGLIGRLGSGGRVQNLTLENVNISGNDYVGGVVGANGGTVTACIVSCSVSGSSYVGGVVGSSSGTVTDCTVSCSVSGTGSFVGGVVGNNNSTVTACSASGSISGSISGFSFQVGGVVGYNNGTVTACSASGSISGSDNVGGVVGYNTSSGTVTACYHISGSITGSGGDIGGGVGGAVGFNWEGTVTACYHASGSVSGNSNVGGMMGWNRSGTVTACYWSDYNGNGLNGDTGEATKVDGEDVTWGDAVDGMNAAIETWNSNNSGSQCDWKYVLTGDLPTLTKQE